MANIFNSLILYPLCIITEKVQLHFVFLKIKDKPGGIRF